MPLKNDILIMYVDQLEAFFKYGYYVNFDKYKQPSQRFGAKYT